MNRGTSSIAGSFSCLRILIFSESVIMVIVSRRDCLATAPLYNDELSNAEDFPSPPPSPRGRGAQAESPLPAGEG